MKLLCLEAISGSDGGLKAEFSDDSSLILSAHYLPKELDPLLCEAGKELSSWEEDAINFASLCYPAESAALRLIARAEQNSLNLTRKLISRGHNSRVAKAVITSLLERGFLDNKRYAELWIRSRISVHKSRGSKAVSPRQLLISLESRGISLKTAKAALWEVLDSETEYALLLQFIEKNNQEKKGFSLKALLKYEGFSPETLEKFFDE